MFFKFLKKNTKKGRGALAALILALQMGVAKAEGEIEFIPNQDANTAEQTYDTVVSTFQGYQADLTRFKDEGNRLVAELVRTFAEFESHVNKFGNIEEPSYEIEAKYLDDFAAKYEAVKGICTNLKAHETAIEASNLMTSDLSEILPDNVNILRTLRIAGETEELQRQLRSLKLKISTFEESCVQLDENIENAFNEKDGGVLGTMVTITGMGEKDSTTRQRFQMHLNLTIGNAKIVIDTAKSIYGY